MCVILLSGQIPINLVLHKIRANFIAIAVDEFFRENHKRIVLPSVQNSKKFSTL